MCPDWHHYRTSFLSHLVTHRDSEDGCPPQSPPRASSSKLPTPPSCAMHTTRTPQPRSRDPVHAKSSSDIGCLGVPSAISHLATRPLSSLSLHFNTWLRPGHRVNLTPPRDLAHIWHVSALTHQSAMQFGLATHAVSCRSPDRVNQGDAHIGALSVYNETAFYPERLR